MGKASPLFGFPWLGNKQGFKQITWQFSPKSTNFPGERSAQTEGHHPERQWAPTSLPENLSCHQA